MLLTLSNLAALRATVVPQLIAQCEADFSTSLASEAQTVNDVLAQIDTRLFQSYVRAPKERLSATISAGISSPSWPPRPTETAEETQSAQSSAGTRSKSPTAATAADRPTGVAPYVHTALLHLVAVHTEVSTTAAPLTQPVLSHLFEHLVATLLDAVRARAKANSNSKSNSNKGSTTKGFDLRALMQATLDTEFVVQTLSAYATPRAAEVQSAVYAELDRVTEPGAQARLSKELPEMRGVLKRLREATRSEFACFRKEKREKGGK